MTNNLRDTRRLGRWLVGAIWITTALFAAESLATAAGLTNDFKDQNTAMVAFFFYAALLVAFLITTVLAMRWIYLIAKGAYILSNGETTKPGWAVGWYFVPIFHLVKPYRAMREAWQVSKNPAKWRDVDTAYLPAWWGWWLLWSFLSGVGSRIAGPFGREIDLVGAAVSLPAAWLFTRLVRDVSEAQWGNRFKEVFS